MGRPYSAHAARGEGGSTKSVLMRAWGEGVYGALSAHANSLHRGLDLLQEEFFDTYKKKLLVHISILCLIFYMRKSCFEWIAMVVLQDIQLCKTYF